MSLWAMLKLPTSLFECVCFICVNIVSFGAFARRGCLSLYFFRPNLEQTKSQVEKSNEVCVSTLMYFSILLLPSLFAVFYGLFFPEFYFSVYSTLRFPAEVKHTIWRCSSNPESLNCAFGLPYIKINSLSAHRTRP